MLHLEPRQRIDMYLEGLKKAYLGEYFGEALLLSLADQFVSSLQIRNKLAILARLERVTQENIGKVAGDLVREEDCNRAFVAGRRYACALNDLSWRDLMIELLPRVKKALTEFSALARIAPDAHRPYLGILLAHETALESFFVAEIEGNRNSLNEAITVLAQTGHLTGTTVLGSR